MVHTRALGLLVCVTGMLALRAPVERVASNDNRTPAGSLEHGVLTLHLRVTHGEWHPDADADPGTDAFAFAEEGHGPSIPGPLIRVPAGTEVRTTVRNALTDSTIVVFGLSGARGRADSVRIRPGETRELVTRATTPGTFLYRALTHPRNATDDPRPGADAMLGGAFIVDPPGATVRDRVFVIFQWLDTARFKAHGEQGEEILTINGRSWPNTERLHYKLGDTIRWRVINGSFDTHPMHLHGAFFTLLSKGGLNADTVFAPADRLQRVTEPMRALSTMSVEWVPPHAGNWLFHCHLNFHLMAHPSLAPTPDATGAPTMKMTGMGGLILGTTVDGPLTADARPRRHIRLVAARYDSVPGEFVPRFGFELGDTHQRTVPGAPIVVTQNEPVAITVVNHLDEPTSVHWHGLEIQSYYDGVPGFDGDVHRMFLPIAPHDSFTALMTPPRAGTFIYHSHYDDIRQQGGGMYGAFIVLPPGERWDPAHEPVVVLGEAADTAPLKINGVDHPTLNMTRGQTYRVRFINITLARPGVVISLTRGDSVQRWTPVARDGGDLPASHVRAGPARLPITIGETDDVLFTPDRAGTLALDVRSAAGQLLRSATIAVADGRVASGAPRSR